MREKFGSIIFCVEIASGFRTFKVKEMKKILSVLMIAAAFAFTACGDDAAAAEKARLTADSIKADSMSKAAEAKAKATADSIAALPKVDSAAKGVKDAVKDAAKGAKDAVKGAADATKDAAKGAKDAVKGAADAVKK
ncbi:MAG: hypothetical protein ACKVTZ_12270 [Bacteroidia bacterium]